VFLYKEQSLCQDIFARINRITGGYYGIFSEDTLAACSHIGHYCSENEQILQTAGEAFEKKTSLVAQGWDIDRVAVYVARLLDMDVSEVWSVGKYRHIVRARSLLCYWAVRELGVSMASLAKRLRISPAALTQSVVRGERLVKKNHYHFP